MNLDDLALDPAQADTLSPAEVIQLLNRLLMVQSALTWRLILPQPPKEEGKLITKKEAIRRMREAGLRMSDSTWHREQHKYASFIVPREISGGRVLCYEDKLAKYIRELRR